ncbi:hypothetical protein [Marinoscillum sp.]|uniref:hypothetical protein n=1 Tax=Marinoscillum sp. TaxID=2024838 RepID=UPI003BACAE32
MYSYHLRPARVKLLAVILLLSILTLFSSCAASNTKNYSWTDLKHSRELDKKKGKKLKKVQKPYAKRYDY